MADRQFRRRLRLAMLVLRSRGTLSRRDYRRIKQASYSGLMIRKASGSGKPDTFISQLRVYVQREMDLPQGIFDGEDGEDRFGQVVQWLIENWQVVFQLILILFAFMGNELDD